MRSLLLAIMSVAVVTACAGPDGPIGDPTATARLEIITLAEPTCADQSGPITPVCAPRPVDALIVLTDADGSEIIRGATGPDATLSVQLVPGVITVVPQPVDGLPGTPDPITVTLVEGETERLRLDYDTGLR